MKNFLTADKVCSRSTGLLILRIIFGLVVFYGHGLGKLTTIFTGQEIQFGDPIGLGPEVSYYLAAFAEGICSILLILGLFSRLASLVLVINFIVINILHAFILKDGFEILELRFLYIAGWVALSFTGPGKFSLDHLLFKKEESLY